MTEPSAAKRWTAPEMRARLKRRHRTERGFNFAGLAAILTAMAGLLTLLVSILVGGLPAFTTTDLDLELNLTREHLGVQEGMDRAARSAAISRADYGAIVRDALRERFPEVSSRREVRALSSLVSAGARGQLRDLLREDSSLIGQRITLRLPADDEVDRYLDGQIRRDVPESQRRLSDAQLDWIDTLKEQGRLHQGFNLRFLRSGDSREPELAGIWGATMGSFLTLIVTLLIAFPLGVSAAVYLEEFAPRNRWTSLIEVNIHNLGRAEAILDKSMRAFFERDDALASQVAKDDLEIDRLDITIDEGVLKALALQAPVAEDLREVLAIKMIATDLERVGDLARNIAKSARRLASHDTVPYPATLTSLTRSAQRLLRNALDAFSQGDTVLAQTVLDDDDAVDHVQDEVVRSMLRELENHPEAASQEVDIIMVAKNLERVADHATNIAEDVILVAEARNVKHSSKLGA